MIIEFNSNILLMYPLHISYIQSTLNISEVHDRSSCQTADISKKIFWFQKIYFKISVVSGAELLRKIENVFRQFLYDGTLRYLCLRHRGLAVYNHSHQCM